MIDKVVLDTRALLGFKLESEEKLQKLCSTDSGGVHLIMRLLSSKIGSKDGRKRRPNRQR